MWISRQQPVTADVPVSLDEVVYPGEHAEAVKGRPAVKRWIDIVGHWLEIAVRHPIITVASVVMLAGTSVATLDVTDLVFSSDDFCANTCHVMRSTVAKEYQESKHYNTRTGVRPKCASCHVSGRLTLAMVDHFISSRDLFAWAANDSTPDAFEKLRPKAAEVARLEFLENDSKNCRGCHVFEAIKPEKKRGQTQHADAIENKITCIACHYNLVHKEVEPSPKFLKAIDDQAARVKVAADKEATKTAGAKAAEVERR